MKNGNDRRPPLSFVRSLVSNRRGATAAIFAIALPVLAGMGALAVDVGIWTVQKRQAQGAADQAAYSAAIAAAAGANGTTEARAITAGMGFVHGANGVVVTVNTPPATGSHAGQSGFWEVIVQQPQTMGLGAIFLGSAPTARARAVAGLASGGKACIIGLQAGSGINAVTMDNNNAVGNTGCAVYSNSGLTMGNNSNIAGSAYAVGTIDKKNGATIGTEVHGVSPIPDPYADVPVSPPSCLSAPAKITDGDANNDGIVDTYSPGNYCNGIDIRNNAKSSTINLSPGVYYFGSTFNLTNDVTINGTGGVTIVLASGTNVSIGNNLTLNITAPTTGTYAGVALMGRNLGTNVLAWNNTTFNVQGAIYFPNQTLSIKNNAADGGFNTTKCTQLVAYQVQLNNNASMNNNCPGSGIRDVGGGKVALLE